MNEDEARDREAEEKRLAAPLAAALFQEHADWLRRYMRRLANNRSLPPSLLDPDDVVQEAFVQLLRHNWDEPIRNPGASPLELISGPIVAGPRFKAGG